MKTSLIAKHAISLFAVLSFSFTAMAEGELELVKESVQNIIGQRSQISDVKLSPMEGVYEITFGGRTMYASQAGKHVLLGDVYDTERSISLSEEMKQAKSIELMQTMPESEMIVFGDDSAKRTITVYTDVDCGYCQKLHQEVPALVDAGVKVRYLWYPRAGIGSDSYKKAVSVWCAEDQLAAMDNAKLKRSFTNDSCDPNPVASQYESGSRNTNDCGG
jgi:thiol:disulfide interchange protein DsbC